MFQRHLRFFGKWFVISWQTVSTSFCSILAWLKLTTVFTVTTECISQNGSEKKFQQQDINIIAHSQTRPVFFFFQKELRQPLFIWYGHATTKKVSHKVDETECRWTKCAPSEGNSVGATVHPCERCRPTVVLSSASERPETELFLCRCSLGAFVTEDSSEKTKRGKLSVEMTDQPFVTKWTICLQTRYSFLPLRRPPWLRKHFFSTAQVHVMIGSPSSALSIPEEEEEELFSATSIAFVWL